MHVNNSTVVYIKIKEHTTSLRLTRHDSTRGFNLNVNISESCDFRLQFDPLNTIV